MRRYRNNKKKTTTTKEDLPFVVCCIYYLDILQQTFFLENSLGIAWQNATHERHEL
jgi:hypothetical protein